MSKPEPVEIPSDDCVLTIGGRTFAPHEGEAIWAWPGMTVAEVRLLREMQTLQVKMATLEDEDEDGRRRIAEMDDAFRSVGPFLSARLSRWNWTDDSGRPYSQPGEDPAVFDRLRIEELAYLVAAINGQAQGQRKNVSRPSPITSSATAPVPIQTRSAGGRSRSRA